MSVTEGDNDDSIDFKLNTYVDDLQLAAELGKNLLERNQMLETQIQQMLTSQNDQKLEIELLQKQIEVLKNVNESRLHMYEDVDRNAQELERMNHQLLKDRKCDKNAISRLNDTTQKLEEKCADLESLLEDNVARTYGSSVKLIRKRINSVPSLTKVSKDCVNFEFSGIPSSCNDDEMGILYSQQQQIIKRLQMQITIEKNKRTKIEGELGSVLQEYKLIEDKFLRELHALEAQLNEKQKAKCSESLPQGNPTARCSKPFRADKELLIECDIDSLPRGKLIRLKNGGSAYGSQESLHMIGLEADEDLTPSIEVCSAILASDISNRVKDQRITSSLLMELEEQYHSLVNRYEALIEAKQKSSQTDQSTQDNLDISQTLKNYKSGKSSLDLLSPVDPTEGHFEASPPEYKRLFKEIFQTLRKSILSEGGL